MKNQMKRAAAIALCLVLLAGLILPQLPIVNAVDVSNTVPQKHYSSYSELALVYDQNSCYSMQGMTVDNTYVYCAKIGSNDARATVTRIDKNSGAKTLMTNASTGYSYFTNLGHANALDIVTVNGKENLFVTGGANLIRLTISGTKLTTAGTYTATYNGAAASMTAAQIMSASDTQVKVLVKSGRTLYTGTLNPAASSGNIELIKLCTLDIANVQMNGKQTDLSSFTQQGFDYHDGKLFLPLTGNAYVETINQSAVLVYDLEGATGNLRNDPSLSFFITCSTYAGLFEMEDCAVCPTTGKLYFASNRRRTASDTNHDGVSYFKNYVYDPSMSTTGADDYRWELKDNEFLSVTKGGNVFNEAKLFHGNISDGTMNQAIYSLSRSVVLKHDQPWVVEWKSSGSFGSGSMLLATSRTRGVTNSPFLFRNKNSEFIAFGYWNGSTHSNYGIRLGDYGIDGTAEHTYRLTNKIADDGSNMVYLSVDGNELGAMNNYYINATSQKTTSNWISGKDFTFSYMGAYGHPLNYCKLDYMQVWAEGEPEVKEPTQDQVQDQVQEPVQAPPPGYRWELNGNDFASVTNDGNVDNALSLLTGSVSNGIMSKAVYGMNHSVVLKHDQPWIVEWKSSGNFKGGSMLLSNAGKVGVTDAPFLFRYEYSEFIAFGYWNGSSHRNYGIRPGDYGIDGTAEHTYRLTNKIASDGSNMVYLSVDGQELGAMNNYYVNGSYQKTTSNWVSGKDFSFSYLGATGGHPLNSCQLDYMQIWTEGLPDVKEPTADCRWELSGDDFDSVTTGGNVGNALSLLTGSVSNGIMSKAVYGMTHSVVLKHDQPWIVEWKSSGNFKGGSMLLSNSGQVGVTDAPFLFRYQNSEFIAFGYWNGSSHRNYGIRPGDYGIDGTAEHTYRLTNKIAADGSNMVYLSVDGKELGAMNNYYVNGSYQKTTSNWISGKDFSFSYLGATGGHPLNSCKLDYLQIWGAEGLPEEEKPTQKPVQAPTADCRWELSGNNFDSVTNGGNVGNALSLLTGSVSNGIMSKAVYGMTHSVVLKHDQPWTVEWKSSGNFKGGSMLLSNSGQVGVTDAPFLFRYQNSEFIAFGYWNGSSHRNYGIRPGDYGIDGTAEHTYLLTNKIAADGSNMVYLSVDGRELGAMNNYYVNGSYQKTTSNWISGKDFSFSYLGATGGHPLNSCKLDYLQIRGAEGLPEEKEQPMSYRWQTNNDLNAVTGDGLIENHATLYRGSVTGTAYSDAAYRLEQAVKLMHDRPWSVEWQSQGVSGGTFLLAASDGSKTKNAPFLFRYSTNLLFLGNFDGTVHANCGIDLSDYGISGADKHIYRLTNKIAEDGSNMVYLSVDGRELGAMNNCYEGLTDLGTTSDWVSGKDFVFDYMGNSAYTIKGSMDYIQVWEDGAP